MINNTADMLNIDPALLPEDFFETNIELIRAATNGNAEAL
jgi:hypothetical protein